MTVPCPETPAQYHLRLPDQIQRLQAANQRLEDFTHIASHDLRSPLRAMISLAEWVREDVESAFGKLPEQIEADFAELEKQGARMGKLLQDLLDFSQVGKNARDTQPFDSKATIHDCVDVCALPEGFSVTVAKDVPSVSCSPVEFAMAIRNLVCNAYKHHDRTTGQILIDGWEENGFGYFRVRDDGPGVDPQHAKLIFEAFKTLDSSRGNGIGLGLVQKIAGEYGGIARMQANPQGRGSDFIFSLPLENPSAHSEQLLSQSS